MNKQPEALILAENLEHQVYRGSYDWERVEPMMLKAATKLRRLHEVNQELLEALQAIVRSAELNQAAVNTFLLIDARSAIAKAGGSNEP